MHGQGSALVSSPLGLCLITTTAYVYVYSYLLDYPILFHKKVILCHGEHSNIFMFVVSPHHTGHCKHVNHFSTVHDDKITIMVFKFNVPCEWIIHAIHQSFPH